MNAARRTRRDVDVDVDVDGDDFDALYRRELRFVWRVLRYHGVPETGIEDAVQDVFVTVHRRWSDWSGESRARSPRSWLFSVSRRVASAHRRSATRHQRRLEAAPHPELAQPMDDQIANRQAIATLQEALETMDDKNSAVFMLAELEGMTAPEIAELLGFKVNTVYWRLRTARAEVARVLEAREGEGEGEP